MSEQMWVDFPKDFVSFEDKFGTESACRRYLLTLRFGGRPRCSRCASEVWELSDGRLECKSCGYQGSAKAGTIFHRSQKPLRLWFRAIWEMVTRKNGISAKDLQRMMSFGSYETAWRWLHKLRSLLDPRTGQLLSGSVQLDEGQIGHKKRVKSVRRPQTHVFVAAECKGRVRLAKGPDEKKQTVKSFVNMVMTSDAQITTDKHGSHHPTILGHRLEHLVKSTDVKDGPGPLQQCHWALSLLKRWWMGTHHGGIAARYSQAYFDEFTFRYNRRKTKGVGRIVARVLQRAAQAIPLTQHQLRHQRLDCPWFQQQPESIG